MEKNTGNTTLKKVLIAEDDKDFLWILRQSFEGQPFFVSYAMDGQEALVLAEKEKPDLIILDILMPKMDGITVARHLKEKGINTQIIFLTNLEDAKHVSDAIAATGGSDYIVKSNIRIDAIITRVKDKLGIQ